MRTIKDGKSRSDDSKFAFVDMARRGKTNATAIVLAIVACVAAYQVVGIALGFMWGFGLALNQAFFYRPMPAPEFIQLATIFLASIALFVGLRLAMIRVLRRPLLSAVSVDMSFRPGRVALGAALWLFASVPALVLLAVIAAQSDIPLSTQISNVFKAASGEPKWIAWLLCIAIFPFQTAIEELAFRGCLTQSLGQILRVRWLVAVIVAVLFAAMHGLRGWPSFWYYVSMSLGLSAISLMDQRLELAMGAHLMNNIWAAGFALLLGASTSPGQPSNILGAATWLGIGSNATRYVAIIGLMWMLVLLRRQRIRAGTGRRGARLQDK
jgi:membrane protease YdiL (CAAX protease family)